MEEPLTEVGVAIDEAVAIDEVVAVDEADADVVDTIFPSMTNSPFRLAQQSWPLVLSTPPQQRLRSLQVISAAGLSAFVRFSLSTSEKTSVSSRIEQVGLEQRAYFFQSCTG